MMIIVTGEALLSPANREEGIRLGCEHSRRSRSEPGCIAHRCVVDAENPDRIAFNEEWADLASLQRHFAVPESSDFVRRLAAMSLGTPVMRIFTAQEVPGPQL